MTAKEILRQVDNIKLDGIYALRCETDYDWVCSTFERYNIKYNSNEDSYYGLYLVKPIEGGVE